MRFIRGARTSRSELGVLHSQHGTCPACRHPFLPELLVTESDDESSDGGEYVPTEYDAESDMETDLEDYRDDFFGSDGVDIRTMPYPGADAPSGAEYSDIEASAQPGAQDSDDEYSDIPYVTYAPDERYAHIRWWDHGNGSVDGEQEWGLTDGESGSLGSEDLLWPEAVWNGDHIPHGMPFFASICSIELKDVDQILPTSKFAWILRESTRWKN